jgi:hypothetical protein
VGGFGSAAGGRDQHLVFTGATEPVASYDPMFLGGVTVADVNGDGMGGDDVVVDGRIITGDGSAMHAFGDGSVRFLTSSIELF